MLPLYIIRVIEGLLKYFLLEDGSENCQLHFSTQSDSTELKSPYKANIFKSMKINLKEVYTDLCLNRVINFYLSNKKCTRNVLPSERKLQIVTLFDPN